MYAMLLATNVDEKAILSLVLQRSGLAVTTTSDLGRAMKTWLERPADLIVLALDLDPVTQVQRARSETKVPIVLIADAIDEDSHCSLLETGADLVLARPFSARLFISQVQALMRRAGSVPLFSLPTLDLGGLTLDSEARTVQLSGYASRRLAHLEFRLLYTLMSHRGQILPAEVIVDPVWGYTGSGDRELVRASSVGCEPR